MLVEPWKVMVDAFRKAFLIRTNYRKRIVARPRRKVAFSQNRSIESLEDRTLLSITGALNGNDVAFQGSSGGPTNVLIFTVDGSGNLQHNLGGQFGFNSNIDLDSAVPGDQTRLVTSLTRVDYSDQDAVANDTVIFGSNQFNFTNTSFTGLTINAGSIAVQTNARIVTANNGLVALTSALDISLATGSNITSQNGSITLTANQQPTPGPGTFVGILLDGASITSGTGPVNLHGKGGIFGVTNYGVQLDSSALVRGGDVQITGEGGSGGDDVYGVLIDNSSTVTSNGLGGVTVKGDGGGTNRRDIGVYVRNSGAIISGGGDVHVIGGSSTTGIDDGYGVYVELAGTISAGGGGDVLVEGTGHGTGNVGIGVRVGFGGSITSGGGNVQVIGTGSDSGGSNNYGVELDKAGSQITAGGSGSVTVTGNGNGSGANNVGVWLETGSKITSSGGEVQVNGTGGNGAGDNNHGVVIDATGGEISSGGSGQVTVTGNGGGGTGNSNRGISIVGAASTITQGNGGNISLFGTGNGTGLASSSYGVYFANGAQIRATGSGSLGIQGIGGSGTGAGNFGVFLEGATIVTANGNLTIGGTEGAGPNGIGINIQTGGTTVQATGTGNIFLTADSIDIGNGTAVNAGTHLVAIRTFAGSTPTALGPLNDPINGPLSLSDAELDRITAGTLRIGGADNQAITVSGDITRSSSTNVQLITNNNVIIDGGQFNTGGGTLLIQAGGGNGLLLPPQDGVDLTASSVTLNADVSINISGLTVDTQYDQLNVNGSVNLAGAELKLTGGYTFLPGDTVTIVAATDITNTFAGLPNNATLFFNAQLLQIRYTTTTVTLSLPLVNSPPVITSPGASTVNENTPTSAVVFDVDATDSDLPAQTLTYSISGLDAALFTIDTATGEIRFLNISPDFELPADGGADNHYNMTVTVSDGNGGLDSQLITIEVLPLNDNVPLVTPIADFSVNENFSTITIIADVNATDADLPGQTLTYSLQGLDAPRFTIDTATGEIRFAASPDFEVPDDANGDHIYDVSVLVSDGNGGTSVEDFSVTIQGLNDNDPSILSAANVQIDENTPAGNVILDVNATDLDQPAQTLTYSLSGADRLQFSLNTATGEIRFLTSPDFEIPTDADNDNIYQLTVTVTDDGGRSTTQNLTITVAPLNDNLPVITPFGNITVDENTSTTVVILDVNATDADAPVQTLTYSLAGIDAAHFLINANTGELRFKNLPDFENPADQGGNNVYDITIVVSDGNGGASTRDLTVSVLPVNDNLPLISSPGLTSVDENTPAGTVVLDVNATDADAPNQVLEYSLSGLDEPKFSIDSVTGEIRFLVSPDADIPGASDGDNNYQLTVNVDDGNGGVTTQSIVIAVQPVNDNSPVITSPTDAQIISGTSIATVVLDIDATDADQPAQTLSYSLAGPDSTAFSINIATGEIRFLSSPDFLSPHDANGDNVYLLSVTVKDDVAPILSVTRSITITVVSANSPPAASAGTLIINEDSPVADLLKGADPDTLDVLTFSVVSPPLHGTVIFLNAQTGEYQYTAAANYNGPDSFTFKVNDGQVDSNIALVNVTVNAVNDAPVFTAGPNQVVLEDAPPQVISGWATRIAPGPATAIDEAGQALTFIVTTTNDAMFAVLPAIDTAGNLTFTLAPNTTSNATITVILKDKGGTVNSGVDTSLPQTFTISVTPVNDPPQSSDETFSVRENSPNGTIVGTVTGTDPDIDDILTFAIVSGNTGGTFAINPLTGQITVADNTLLTDFSTPPTFVLQVSVTDVSGAAALPTITIVGRDGLLISFGNSQPATFVKSAGPVRIDTGAIARDSDVADINFGGGRLTITNRSHVSGDRLSILTQQNNGGPIGILSGNIVYRTSLVIIGQVDASSTASKLVIRLTSYATEAAVDALLQAIYFNTTDKSTGVRNIEFDLKNGSGLEHDTKTTTVRVNQGSTGVTQFALADAPLVYDNSTQLQQIDPLAFVSESLDLRGGRLTITGKGLNRLDRLGISTANGITVAGTELRIGLTVIGHLTSTSSSLTIDFSETEATASAVLQLLRSVAFSTTAGKRNQPNRVITFRLTDLEGGSWSDSRTVRVVTNRRR